MKLVRNSQEHIDAAGVIDFQFNRELNEIKLSFLDTHPGLKNDDLENEPDWRFVVGKLEERRTEAFQELKLLVVDAAGL